MVDKNLFLYDLAVVAILKNEGHYLQEWLDYHLLAGVDHFYLYDNDSIDNQAEVVKPYVEAGLVDYFYMPGIAMQYIAYNDAVKKFKFYCRYMAFIDLDEFIFPKTNRSVVEVADEILSPYMNAAGLAINWQIFGSNGQLKADYSHGVLERFTQRALKNWTPNSKGNAHIKTVANPRRICFIAHSHFPIYFRGFYSVNENSEIITRAFNNPVTVEKIALNHYYGKSREEFNLKHMRGRADTNIKYDDTVFDFYNRNEEFDDGILKYRAARAENFSLKSADEKFNRVKNALNETLSRYADSEIFDLETALTCRSMSNYLGLKIHEEASLAAILKSLNEMNLVDAKLFIRDLPNLLKLSYTVIDDLRNVALQIISQLMERAKLEVEWQEFVELDYLRDLLKE